MAGLQTNNIQILDESSPFLTRTLESSDTLRTTSNWEFAGDVTFEGVVTSVSKEEIRIADNHVYLNDGYTTAVAETGGLVVNYLPIALTDTVAGAGFTAGIAATSNPTVGTTGAATFAVGQFIQISGANDPENNGLYEVLSHAANVLTIRGVGTTGTVEDFTETQFVTDSTITTSELITRVNLSILRAGTDGAWETAVGATTGLTFTDLATGANVTLQQAYDADPDGGDATITTNATDGAVVIAGDQEFRVTATNGINVDTRFDADVTVFDVLMTGANGFSIDGTAASNVSVDSGNLTLSTTTTGGILVNSVGIVDVDGTAITVDGTTLSLDGTDTTNLTMTANDGAAKTMTIQATNAGAGTGNLDINVDDAITMDSASFSVDGTAASNVSVTGANLTLSTVTSGDVDILAAGDVDVDGTNIQLDATGNFSIDGATSSNATVSGTSAGALNLTLSAVNAGAGTGNVLVAADDEVDVTSASLDLNMTGAATLDAASFSWDATTASNVSVTGANLTLSTLTSGSLNLTSAGDSTYTVPNASATAWTLTDGSVTYARVDSVTDCLELTACVQLSPGNGVVYEYTTDDSLVEGDLVYLKTNGNVALADADTGTLKNAWVTGISTGTFAPAATARIVQIHGSLVPIAMTAAPAAASNGLPIYLSATAGKASTSIPGGPASTRVVFIVGVLQGADGADTTPLAVFTPQFVSRGPGVS